MTECRGAEEEGHFHVNPPYDHGKGEHRLTSSQTCICGCRSGQGVVSGQPRTSSVLLLCLPFVRHSPELRSSALALSLARISWSSSCGLALGRQSGRGPQFGGTPLGAPWGSGCSVVHPWALWGPPILESWMRTLSECVCSQPQRTRLGSARWPPPLGKPACRNTGMAEPEPGLVWLQGSHQPPRAFWLLADLFESKNL